MKSFLNVLNRLILTSVSDGVSTKSADNLPIDELADRVDRSLMGPKQEDWLYEEMILSQYRNATWRILGNQVGELLVLESVTVRPEDGWKTIGRCNAHV